MIKHCLFLFLIVLSALTLFGQSPEKKKAGTKEDGIYFNPEPQNVKKENTNRTSHSSIVAGLNLTSFKTSILGSTGDVSVTSDPKIGFHAGYLMSTRYNQSLGFRTGLVASFESGDFDEEAMSLLYSSIPLQAQFFITDKMVLNGGLNFDVLILEFVDGELVSDDESISRYFNPGLAIGAEYNITPGFALYVSYNKGLNNLITAGSRDLVDDMSIRMKKTVFQFGLSFNFK